jgi:hypothetical protein
MFVKTILLASPLFVALASATWTSLEAPVVRGTCPSGCTSTGYGNNETYIDTVCGYALKRPCDSAIVGGDNLKGFTAWSVPIGDNVTTPCVNETWVPAGSADCHARFNELVVVLDKTAGARYVSAGVIDEKGERLGDIVVGAACLNAAGAHCGLTA